jgi:hypothetical protein
MLELLLGKASERKLRLFACACCRLVWEQLVDGRSRQAVLIAEQFADGLVGKGDLRAAHQDATNVSKGSFRVEDWLVCGNELWFASLAARMATARRLPLAQVVNSTLSGGGLQQDKKYGDTSHILRDLLGPSPFRTLTLDPAVLVWNDGTVPKLARAVYDERAFDRMPILGDALEDAGCEDQNILRHCRQRGAVHVRGCFVLDLLLNKE